MPDLPKKTQDQEGSRLSSEMNEKRNSLINELSDLLEKTGKNHGPFLMDELLRRLDVVVNNFNEELTSLIKGSFKRWKDKDSQLPKNPWESVGGWNLTWNANFIPLKIIF